MSDTKIDKITIVVDKELQDIVPDFLKRRSDDVEKITVAISQGDLKTLQTLGHNMKGNGAGYGFAQISVIGAAIEAAAIAHDIAVIETQRQALAHFLTNVEVTYQSD
jgi:histidine phosphotransfer protein HptB